MFENNNYNYNDNNNTIIIDVNARRKKKQKILCVLCKIQLECINPEVDKLSYKCPRCKNTYQLYYEILEHEDDFTSSHEEDEDIELAGLDNNDSVGLLVANDEDDKEEEKYKTKSDIPIPKYMKNSETTEVIEYREE